MKKRLQALRNEDGLTLVELLAVIVILAIVSVIAFVMISQVIENSKKDAHVANALQLINSAKLYEANGLFKDEAEATLKQIQDAGFVGDIIDPWGKTKVADLTGNKVVRDAAYGYKVILSPIDNAKAKCAIKSATEVNLATDARDACDKSY